VYTQAFNRRHRRVGHLLQGRFKGILVEKESHLLEVCRYVVLNPVAAAMVKQPVQWAWNSYRATSGRSLIRVKFFRAPRVLFEGVVEVNLRL
jgi:hypothetical protein